MSIRFKVTKTKTSFVEVKEFLLSNSKIDETKYYFETLISQAVVEKINKKRQKGIDISGTPRNYLILFNFNIILR